jgi:hypothetical protein
MTQLFTGLAIGVLASLIAGLILAWKGDKIVEYLRCLPERRRIGLFTKAYLLGIRRYPYRFLYMQGLVLYFFIHFFAFILYFFLTGATFYKSYFPTASIEEIVPATLIEYADSLLLYIPWFLAVLTLLFGYYSVRLFFNTVVPEVMAPYGYYEISKLRDCVSRHGTKKQYLDFVNALHEAKDHAGIIRVLDLAQISLGDARYSLLDEIRKSITTSNTMENGG